MSFKYTHDYSSLILITMAITTIGGIIITVISFPKKQTLFFFLFFLILFLVYNINVFKRLSKLPFLSF